MTRSASIFSAYVLSLLLMAAAYAAIPSAPAAAIAFSPESVTVE